MDKDILQRYFFITALFLVSVLIFFIFLPFFEIILISVVFALVLSPLYKKISKFLGGWNRVSAVIVILLFTVVIIVPSFFLATELFGQSKDLYTELTNNTKIDYLQKITDSIEKPVRTVYPDFSLDMGKYVSGLVENITSHLTSILTSVASIITSIILIFISLYFFLKDGSKFKKILISLSPLSDEYDEHIASKIKQTINATVKGVLLVAVIQGILAGLGMFLFGVPNATLWGSVSAIASLVPGLGTAIVFIPAVAYMLIIGNTPFAIGLILWGVLIVGLVDNFLTPYLYSKSIQIHQLIMLFAVLGGLAFFGPIGFLFGPIAIGLFFSMLEIYQTLILQKKPL